MRSPGTPALFALALAGCSPRPPAAADWPLRELRFPESAEFDYAPSDALAHAALPLVDHETGVFAGPGRVWIKGSAAVTAARVGGGERIELEPPFYVALVDAEPGRVTVEFDGAESVPVDVPDARALNAPRASFALLAYGCFDPFAVADGEPIVDPGGGAGMPGEKPESYAQLPAARELFRDAALGRLPDLAAADVILGVGDQVYVEGAHDQFAAFGERHPLSAWTVEPRPRPRLGLNAFTRFLDEVYRRTWSFTTLDEAFRAVPCVMTWDDHEIRDGWGSQGDEHVYRDTYYAAARKAFVEHQLRRGPRTWKEPMAEPHAPLHQAFELHGLPVFVLDERSARDVRVPQVLGDEQWAVFEAWMQGLDPARSDLYVLVSSMPLLFRVGDVMEMATNLDEEVLDDYRDFWSSEPNTPELDRVMAAMAGAWERGLRAVVISGDMHLSAFLRAEIRTAEGEETFAYEIVTSGLAGRLGGGGWKLQMARVGATDQELAGARLSIALGMAEPVPNFGALELVDGHPVAHLVQVHGDGPVHYRVPLQWGAGADGLKQMLAAGRQ